MRTESKDLSAAFDKSSLVSSFRAKSRNLLPMLIGNYVHAYNTEKPHEALEYTAPDTVY